MEGKDPKTRWVADLKATASSPDWIIEAGCCRGESTNVLFFVACASVQVTPPDWAIAAGEWDSSGSAEPVVGICWVASPWPF